MVLMTARDILRKVLVITLFIPVFAFGQSVEDLQTELSENAQKIKQLNDAIRKDQATLNKLSGEKRTLTGTVNSLRSTEQKLIREITSTQSKISKTENVIRTLSEQSTDLSESIANNKRIISGTIAAMARESDTEFIEAIFMYQSLSRYLDRSIALEQTGDLLQQQFVDLEEKQQKILGLKEAEDKAKQELLEQKGELGDKRAIVASTKRQTTSLLNQTKNQEKAYQRSLTEKRTAIREFEAAIASLENRIQIALNRDAFARPTPGLFRFPFKGWYRITQYFGNTSYSRTGAYNGRGHSGVDFATPMGTPVYAPAGGVVTAADDTGAYGGYNAAGKYVSCLSYGKWIVINHQNGLSTRFNHLSLIKVADGQAIKAGQLIGYSGNTGISTGPHLHMSVMATQGVQIKKLGEVITTNYCRNARAPIVAGNAYLDPFAYLPRPKYNLVAVSEGQRGANVRNLQMMLKHERIFPIEISANGMYGPTTAKAVAAWKKKYGLVGDGSSFGGDAIERYKALF